VKPEGFECRAKRTREIKNITVTIFKINNEKVPPKSGCKLKIPTCLYSMTSRLLLRNGTVQSLNLNSHSISKRWLQTYAGLRAGAKTRMFESLGAPEVEPKYQARRIKKQTPKSGQAKAAIDDIVKNKWARPESTVKSGGNKKPQDPSDRQHQRAFDKHPEKHTGEPPKLHQRHVEKFTQEHKHKGDLKRSKKKEEEKARKLEEERLAALKYERQLKAEAEAKEKKNRMEQEQVEKAQRDVYIPEVVNIANLARVLGIRLGKDVEKQLNGRVTIVMTLFMFIRTTN
jgi:flagellar biosynthesis GTPase FlhF